MLVVGFSALNTRLRRLAVRREHQFRGLHHKPFGSPLRMPCHGDNPGVAVDRILTPDVDSPAGGEEDLMPGLPFVPLDPRGLSLNDRPRRRRLRAIR